MFLMMVIVGLIVTGQAAERFEDAARIDDSSKSHRGKEHEHPVAAPVEHEPLAIVVSTVGRFSEGASWHLSINASGRAALRIETFPEKLHRAFQVSANDLDTLRQLVFQEGFFDLEDAYGQVVPDGSTETITVVLGNRVKTVRLHFLMNWVNTDRHLVQKPARAVRVLMHVRGWFDDPEAVDLRPFHRKVIEASTQPRGDEDHRP